MAVLKYFRSLMTQRVFGFDTVVFDGWDAKNCFTVDYGLWLHYCQKPT